MKTSPGYYCADCPAYVNTVHYQNDGAISTHCCNAPCCDAIHTRSVHCRVLTCILIGLYSCIAVVLNVTVSGSINDALTAAALTNASVSIPELSYTVAAGMHCL